MDGKDWFRERELADGLIVYDEPFVHDFFRANMFHLSGRDRDLLVDTGMGLARLSDALRVEPGKPLLALATHIHVDHVGSLNEFAERAGPAVSAEAFNTMDDAVTYADMYRVLDEPVSRTPAPGWKVDAYKILPAPLTMLLGEGDSSISATADCACSICPAIHPILSACLTSAMACSSAAMRSTTTR